MLDLPSLVPFPPFPCQVTSQSESIRVIPHTSFSTVLPPASLWPHSGLTLNLKNHTKTRISQDVRRDTVGCPDSISTKDLMEKTHQLPISVMMKRLRWLGNVVVFQTIIWSGSFLLRGYPNMCNLLDGLVTLGCIML